MKVQNTDTFSIVEIALRDNSKDTESTKRKLEDGDVFFKSGNEFDGESQEKIFGIQMNTQAYELMFFCHGVRTYEEEEQLRLGMLSWSRDKNLGHLAINPTTLISFLVELDSLIGNQSDYLTSTFIFDEEER